MSDNYNTQSARSGESTALPRYEWPKPGTDSPRLDFASWLRLAALQAEQDYPGDPGHLISAHLIAVAEHCEQLGAHSPSTYFDLSQAAADREAAYRAALENEVLDQAWEINDNVTGALDGHPDHPEWCDNNASQYWVADDPSDETFLN